MDEANIEKVKPTGNGCVVALDFGTAFSGSAVVTCGRPDEIMLSAPGLVAGDAMVKVPTALLQLDSENGEWEFGQFAEELYQQLSEGGSERWCRMYRNFKMELAGKNQGIESITAQSVCGLTTRPLIDLVTMVFKKLKDHVIDKKNQGFLFEFSDEEIQWVLTIPAIWNDFGRFFMREAALRAGLITNILSNNLTMVFEPEAAAIAVHSGQKKLGAMSVLVPGTKFMVLDCGGGTVDITVHEVLQEDPLKLRGLDIPTGGPWGGNYVNENFQRFLSELIGKDLNSKSMKESHQACINQIRTNFNDLKFQCNSIDDPSKIYVGDVLDRKDHLVALAKAWNAKETDARSDRFIRMIEGSLKKGYLPMSNALMLSFFEPLLAQTVEAVRAALARVPDVKAIILVGGFGASKVVIARIKAEFDRSSSDGLRVILPDRTPKPQAAIVWGAVEYGLRGDTLDSRLSPYTFGLAMRIGGVDNRFHVLVHKGQELPNGHSVDVEGIPARADQKHMSWRVFRSDNTDPYSVADATGNVTPLGVVTLVCPLDDDPKMRKQVVHFMFGGAEILLTVTNSAGQTVPLSIQQPALAVAAAGVV